MVRPGSMHLGQKQAQSLKQSQRLMMSQQMQQAIRLLQMPIMELSTIISQELQQNPVLEDSLDHEEAENEELLHEEQSFSDEEEHDEEEEEPELLKEIDLEETRFEILKQLDHEFDDHSENSEDYSIKRSAEESKMLSFIENSICAEVSLYETLMQQAHDLFTSEEELKLAEIIIGNLDEHGFFSASITEIAALHNVAEKALEKTLLIVQSFDPPGIAAKNIRESLLLQLRRQKRQDSLEYRIVDSCYDELIHNRVRNISKTLHCPLHAVEQAIQELARLSLHPASLHTSERAQPITPDVTIRLEGEQLLVEVNDDFLPSLRLNSKYLKMLVDENTPVATKEYIQKKIASGQWLVRGITQRNDTLNRIAQHLAKEQRDYLINPHGKLSPMTMKSVAHVLGLHESTIARAVSNKYLHCPRGLLPLRSFFTNAYITPEGTDVSSHTVRGMLLQIIQNEDKKQPLSDENISNKLKALGIPCARRTVAKYRLELNIGNTSQRKRFS